MRNFMAKPPVPALCVMAVFASNPEVPVGERPSESERSMANPKHHDSPDAGPRKGFFARWFESLAESRMRQIRNEIGPHHARELERLMREHEHEENVARASDPKRAH
jgi:hypothetical protein